MAQAKSVKKQDVLTDSIRKKTIPAKNDDEPDAYLLKLVEKQRAYKVNSQSYTEATFKTTHIANGQSIENLGKGLLDFRVVHRFGSLNQGSTNFYGLDNATTQLAFDYGLTNRIMIGLSRSTYQKEYNGSVKIKILRQTNDDKMPLSLSYAGDVSMQSLPAPILQAGQEYYFGNRLYYVNQILLARKFNSSFSLQLMPTHIHYNLVETATEPNNVLAMGVGGRIKLSKRIALSAEYYYTIPGSQLEGYHNSLSIGIDVETGGHVFQLLFTNSTGVTERTFIGQTTEDWANGGIHFGFNISRVFSMIHPK